MGLSDRIEESVCRVATHNSTKNRLAEIGSNKNNKNKCRNVRVRKEPESNLSDSQQSDESRETKPIATLENGVGTSRIPEDIVGTQKINF